MAVQLLFFGCCLRDLFNIARSIFVQFVFSFFSLFLVSVNVVHPWNSIDVPIAWKKVRLILSDTSDFHIIDSLPIVVDTFARRILMSFYGDEIMLPRYVIKFRKITNQNEDESFLIKTLAHGFVYIHVETNTFCCLLQEILQRIRLG